RVWRCALQVLVVALALAVLVRFLRGDGGPRTATAFGLLLAAASYTNFTSAMLLLAAFAATLLVRVRSRDPRYTRLLRDELLAGAPTVPFLACRVLVHARV